MKKYIVCLLLVISLFVFIPNVDAITIRDLKDDLKELKDKKNNALKNEEITEQEIAETKEKMRQLAIDMVNTIKEQESKEKEIEELNVEIDNKEKEIKDLVVFYQASNNENFYLKYIFGAESFTDFIYRFSVIEQLTTRNNELVDEMNNLIDQNEKKIEELEAKKVEIENLEVESKKQLAKLDDQKSIYKEEGGTYDEQIKALEDQIDLYKSLGCGENENLVYCLTAAPEDTDFIKPLKHGTVTDNYGPRVSPCSGCSSFHKGMDLAAREGTPVMAAASGVVSNIAYYSCGGRVVSINHVVNGIYYTTRYWHLLSYDVKVGDIVLQGQEFAKVGGGSRSSDSCTTGAHLHFETVEGHYYGSGPYSYTSSSTYLSKVFDPRKLIWFPAYGVSW